MTTGDMMSSSGYDREDGYFHEKDRELLAKKRAELDAKRAQAGDDRASNPHWMKCPKCGGDMKEIDLENIKVDKCGACGGIYFDAGEVEMLLQAKQPKGLLERLFR